VYQVHLWKGGELAPQSIASVR